MSQKVQIAGALLSDPELCVLDEPTTGLDPVNVRLVQDLLLERRRNGRTHDPLDAPHESGRGALRSRGAHQQGAADGLRRRRRSPAAILAARGPIVHARGPLPAVPMPPRSTPESDTVSRVMLGERRRAVGAAGRARRRRRAHRPLRADARADGRHLPARRPGGPRMIRWHKVRTVAMFELTSAVRRTGFLVDRRSACRSSWRRTARSSRSRRTTRPSAIARSRRSSASSIGPQLLHLHGRHRARRRAEIDERRAAPAGADGPVRRGRSDAAAIELRVPAVRGRGRGARVARQARPSRLLRPHRRLPADGRSSRPMPPTVSTCRSRTRETPSACWSASELLRGQVARRNRRPGDHAAAGRPTLRGDAATARSRTAGRPPRWSASPCRWRSRCCS